MLGGLFRRGSKSEASWEQASLEAHNKRRAAHGAPPLTWSDECYQEAKKQADDCQRRRALGHGHLTGPSGRHGQNAYWSSAPVSDVDDVVASWYKEVTDHGYNYANPTNTHQTGHFTQVVWHSTSQVGVAKSADGNFVVANYFPAGNLVGNYPKEVLPPRGGQPYPPPAKAAPQPTRRPTATTPTTAAAATATTTTRTAAKVAAPTQAGQAPPPQHSSAGPKESIQVVQATGLTQDVLDIFKECPFDFLEKVKPDLAKGSSITVTLTKSNGTNKIEVKLPLRELKGTWTG